MTSYKALSHPAKRSLQRPWGEMVQPRRKTLKLAETRPTIATLKRSDDVPGVDCGQYPKSALALCLNDVRSPNQMAVAEPSILVFTVVTKYDAYASTSLDGSSAKVSCYRFIEYLGLGLYDSLEIEICMSFSMQIYINCVQHNCVPFAVRMALPGNRHGTICAGIVQDSW